MMTLLYSKKTTLVRTRCSQMEMKGRTQWDVEYLSRVSSLPLQVGRAREGKPASVVLCLGGKGSRRGALGRGRQCPDQQRRGQICWGGCCVRVQDEGALSCGRSFLSMSVLLFLLLVRFFQRTGQGRPGMSSIRKLTPFTYSSSVKVHDPSFRRGVLCSLVALLLIILLVDALCGDDGTLF